MLHGLNKKADYILQLKDPYRIKFEGCFTTDKSWDNNKSQLMLELLLLKLDKCPVFRQSLMSSFPKILLEDTANEFLGQGSNNTGLNTLGCLLMHIRCTLL